MSTRTRLASLATAARKAQAKAKASTHERDAAIEAALNDGELTYTEVATATGLTRTRVSQITRDIRLADGRSTSPRRRGKAVKA